MKLNARMSHNMTHHPLYNSWRGMLERCKNSNHIGFRRYGGRGISVCPRWRTFDNFMTDMGPLWSEGLSLERIDKDVNYEPGNCTWENQSAQMRNQKRNHVVDTPKGSMLLCEAS